MAGGLNALGNTLGKTDANGALIVTLAAGSVGSVTIIGTARQVLANGTSVTPQTGAVTLALDANVVVATSVSIGTTPASAGALRLPAGAAGFAYFRNTANSGDIIFAVLNGNDQVAIGGAQGLTALKINISSVLLISSTAPTIASGFGTSPSITTNNGTAAFTVDVGTGGVATGGVLTLPAAANGWNCIVTNQTSVAANRADQRTVQTASTTTSVTLQNQSVVTGAAVAWAASDILVVSCFAR